MRPAGRAKNESLYFNYPFFSAPQGKKRDHLTSNAQVVIVGAGPIGMTAALALAREGVKSVLFDNKSTFNDGSRAICVARSSFYIFESLGVSSAFLKKSLGWTTGHSFYRGQKILEFQMPDSSEEKFRPMYNIQQQYIEKFLWDAVSVNPLIETRWQSEIIGIKKKKNECTLRVKDPEEIYEMSSNWVLACDGAHSSIRKFLGHRLKGENYEGRYVIVDIKMEHDYPTIRRALFDPDCRRGGTVLIHKQPDNIWRIDYQLNDNEKTQQALDENNVRDSVSAVLKDLNYNGSWELEWWSVYSANTLALDDYRDGRVFFVGDSAHIVPIFGVRGLNNGFSDAANIGWKLGWVLNNKAGKELLNSYSPERRGATIDVFYNSSKSSKFMTPSTYGWKLMRDAALSLALKHKFAGELANPRQFTPYKYSESTAIIKDTNENFLGGPKPGELLPEIKIDAGYLTDLLGEGFTILCFNKDTSKKLDEIIPDGISVVLIDLLSRASKLLNVENKSAYIVRPDGYIAARWKNITPEKIIKEFYKLIFKKEMSHDRK